MSLILEGIDLPTNGEITVTIEADGDAYPRTIGASREHYQAIQIPYDVEDMVDDLIENHELYKKGGRII